jgi:hypothetical protein
VPGNSLEMTELPRSKLMMPVSWLRKRINVKSSLKLDQADDALRSAK